MIKFKIIIKQEYVKKQAEVIEKTVFTLRLMNIFYFRDKQYLKFLKIQSTIVIRLKINDQLIINFDSAARI